MIGTQDLLIGLTLILFFFGAKRLPEIARSLGKSLQEFKKGVSGDVEEGESPQAAISAPGTTPAMRVCASCQAPLELGWTYCPRCGTAVPP
jgi:TatA/E family protein of Tat protein translocase